MAPEKSPHLFECGFLAIDMVGCGIVFVGSPGNIELAVGDDFVVISFLAQRGRGRGQSSSLEEQFRRDFYTSNYSGSATYRSTEADY